MTTPPVVIIGAGPTGLSAAYHLGADALLLDQNDRVGGWCRSIVDQGFTFDYAGHIMFSNDAYVHELYQLLLGDNVHWQNREAWVYSQGVYTRYPFQGALYGLPPEVIKECILGAIEARFGPLTGQEAVSAGLGGALKQTAPANGNGHGQKAGLPPVASRNGSGTNGHGSNGHAPNGANSQPPSASADTDGTTGAGLEDCCADGTIGSVTGQAEACPAPLAELLHREPRNFEEFIYKVWGKGIARHFAVPYNRKIWAVPLAEMETSWLGGRVPLPDLEGIIEGALSPVPAPMGPNARFGYPLRGGFQALMDGFLPHLQGELRLQTRVTAVSVARRTVTLNTGEELPYEALVSTMPLPVLVRSLGDEAPPEIQVAARALRYTSVRCVNLGIGRENLTEKHWIYYPEDTVFHRIFVQGNASPLCNPPGGFGLTAEITYGPQKPLPVDGEALTRLVIEDCIRVGLFNRKDPVRAANQVDLPFAYVVYDHARAENVKMIRDWLKPHNIVLAGRYSEWEYYNSDHAFLAGKRAAQDVRRLVPAPQETSAD